MAVPGAQSVEPRVFVSLSNLNQRTLDTKSDTVSLEPGQTWMEVYDWLANQAFKAPGLCDLLRAAVVTDLHASETSH